MRIRHAQYEKLQSVPKLPFSPALQPEEAYQHLIRTVKDALSDVLMVSDPDSLGLEDSVYVRGWTRPLQRMMIIAVAEDLSCTSDLITSISDHFSQVRRRLDEGTPGPEAFQLLLRILADHFDTSDSESGVLRLQKYTVRKGTFFSVYLRSFCLLVSSAAGSELTLAPTMGMILEIVPSSVMKQFPSLAPTLFPGLLATAVTPFVSVFAMESFSALATNQTPALSGVDHFSSAPTQGSSQHQRYPTAPLVFRTTAVKVHSATP